ncbi:MULTISPECIES: nitrogenase-stabilizing/protective protein NifW [Aliagarivorans]|uniref:nitrogenase-stabilizing/protective protein NifW n=1 Tax=Aliagarivorans TaxID=882379 RepID=UPI0004171831|nr:MULTISPECIES: nitrogenase-stabilizing/protective protein NifW [Aliagarivorans]
MLITDTALQQEIDTLESAEAFLQHFKVEFDQALLRPKRLLFMRLFKQELDREPGEVDRQHYRRLLAKAYCLLERGVIPQSTSSCGGCEGCD